MVSRATFYTYFKDKYDFLKCWLIGVCSYNLVNNDDSDEIVEQRINQFAKENKLLIKHLFIDADNWTLGALYVIFYIIMHMTTDKITDGLANPKYFVLFSFNIGGMIHYIMWQAYYNFPQIEN